MSVQGCQDPPLSLKGRGIIRSPLKFLKRLGFRRSQEKHEDASARSDTFSGQGEGVSAPPTFTGHHHDQDHEMSNHTENVITGSASAAAITIPECSRTLSSQYLAMDDVSSRAKNRVTAPGRVDSPSRPYIANPRTSPGFFSNASYCTLQNPVMNINYHDNKQAMRDFVDHTIRGAEFDSSAREPPPQCHPGTRKSIVETAKRWFHDTSRQKRILWLVGSAGGGKSAIMQTLAEYVAASPSLRLGATLFFSRPNGRNNPLRVFITLAYQIAVQYPTYRDFVLQEFISDPDLPEKAMGTQFAKLIIEPFAKHGLCEELGDLWIFLDGLDECEGDGAQCEIISLISSFSLTYPNVPLVWVIASRPESHLQAMFSRQNILPSYEKEEVPIDTDEACDDVERYLRKEFERIRQDDPIAQRRSQWPTEDEFLTITAAAAGLFAFASTAIKFIGDPRYRNPVAGLELLLAAINKISLRASKGRRHPLAHLDLLYTCILSQIPEGIFPDTEALLTNHLSLRQGLNGSVDDNLVFLCNWTGIPPEDAYGGLHRLHSILTVPPPEQAEHRQVTFHHQSFYEYLKDSSRSQEFHISRAVMHKQELACSLRILKQAHSGMAEVEMAIPVEDVVLSWDTTESEAVQQTLYDYAAWCFAGLIEQRVFDLILPALHDPDITQIARTFNFVGSGSLRHTDVEHQVRFLHTVQHRLSPEIRTEFERLNLLQEVPIGSLNLDNIDETQWTYVRCEGDVSKHAEPVGILGRWYGPVSVDYKSKHKSWWYKTPSNSFDFMRRILRDLRSVQENSPGTLVLLFGNASSLCFMYDFEPNGKSQRWTYYVPYRVP